MGIWVRSFHLEAAQIGVPHPILMPIMKSPSCEGLLAQNRFYVQVLAWKEEKSPSGMELRCVW